MLWWITISLFTYYYQFLSCSKGSRSNWTSHLRIADGRNSFITMKIEDNLITNPLVWIKRPIVLHSDITKNECANNVNKKVHKHMGQRPQLLHIWCMISLWYYDNSDNRQSNWFMYMLTKSPLQLLPLTYRIYK